jgi:hypothetical protein
LERLGKASLIWLEFFGVDLRGIVYEAGGICPSIKREGSMFVKLGPRSGDLSGLLEGVSISLGINLVFSVY